MSQALAWHVHLDKSRSALEELVRSLGALTSFKNESAAQIAAFAQSAGVEINLDAVQATLTRPYTLVPTADPNEWYLVTWRGVANIPVVGWIVSQTEAFTVSRVTRTMNLLSPVPAWMRDEMGWREPEHSAIISSDRASIAVNAGDLGTFKRKYGAHLGHALDGGRFKVKGGKAWIALVAQLIGDGILPYAPNRVKESDWNTDVQSKIVLRDYQRQFVTEFLETGAVLINLPPGAGKTFIASEIIAHLRGKICVFAENTILVEQWRDRLKEFAPHADATVLTYASGHKAKPEKWSLVVYDEVHRLPANTFSELAFLDTQYRLGLTGTPWREDKRQFMIAALAGKPCAVPWNALIANGILKRPRVACVIVRTQADKLSFTRNVLAKRRGGRALIFSDHIEVGKDLARALDVPFVHGDTPNKLARVKEASVCIVSSIAQQGVDLPDLSLVVEYDIALSGSSRTSEAQRVGRLLHSAHGGEHYILFTLDEFQRFHKRMLGVEGEGIEVEYLDLTGGAVKEMRETRITQPKVKRVKPVTVAEGDEVGAILASKAIARLILDFESRLGKTRQGYMARVFRILWKADGTNEELRLRAGKSVKSWEPYQAALNMLVKAGLAKNVDARYYLDRARVNALKG